MPLADIVADTGDWVGLMGELPAESLVTLRDILTEGGTLSGSALVEVPAVEAASAGVSRARVQGEQ